jgi:phage-related protein
MVEHGKKLVARFYQTGLGAKPVREWLLSLSEHDRRTIGFDIQTVEFGWPVGMPVCRPLGQGLWEVRSDLSGNRISRVIFCIRQGEMVLLNGFVKKTQKTPAQEINLALARWRDIK